MKKTILTLITLLITLGLAAPNAMAGYYYLGANNNLVQGCSGTIEIKVNTEGANIVGGDSALNYNAGQAIINDVSIGSALPMEANNDYSAPGTIKLSGARIPGSFSGDGTFGYINLTPSEGTNRIDFTFNPDLERLNNLVSIDLENELTRVIDSSYSVRERYNTHIDGVGSCTPDTTKPTIQFIHPASGSSNVNLDTNIIFSVTDPTGIDIDTLDFSMNGIQYNVNSPQVTVIEDANVYRVELDPDADFSEGENVSINVNICDFSNPANCRNSSASFRTFTPAPPPPECGNGVIEQSNGEQCDDGNLDSGDGCSSLCLLETPTVASSHIYSCSDGLHSPGEEGVDCGGVCNVPCPNCVDGIINQGEEGVDCGGPCPSCELEAQIVKEIVEVVKEYTPLMICHYPEDDPGNPYTMVIPDDLFPEYQANGDVIGACPVFDICSEALFQAAPEIEEKALADAETIIDEEGVIEVQEVVVEVVLDQLDICRENPDFAGADFDNVSADSDSDGLSDRMECYAGSNPVSNDSDGDGCDDYRELNQEYTDPTDPTDCFIEAETEVFSDVLITDPQPGWILTTNQPIISGKVPQSTILVLVVATQSEQNLINSTLQSIESALNLSEASDLRQVQDVVAKLGSSIEKLEAFLENYGEDFNSEPIETVLASIKALDTSKLPASKSELERIKAELMLLRAKPVVVAASTDLADTTVGDFDARNFEEVSNALEDKQLYDLLATAYLNDGSQVNSKAVRFSVDESTFVNAPVPKTLGGELLASIPPFHNIFIGKAFAQGSSEEDLVSINEEKPTITGETEFGSQVFAIWNSVVLSSSVISDSEVGAFEIKAPRNLETGVPHRVTLYAVKPEGVSKIRSDNVDVHFKIKAPGTGLMPVVVAVVGISLLILLLIYLVRRLQRRSMVKILALAKKHKK